MKKILLIQLLIWAALAPAPGQQDVELLSLQEALERAHAHNRRILQSQATQQAQQAVYSGTRAAWLPQLSLISDAVATSDPLQAFGLKLKKEVVAQADFNPALLNDPGANYNLSTRLSVQQPLFNPQQWEQRKAVAEQVKIAGLQTERTARQVRLEVIQAYYQLDLLNRSKRVVEEAIATGEATRAVAHNFFEQGMLLEADVMDADIKLLELRNQLAALESSTEQTHDQLAFLLREDPASARFELTDSIPEAALFEVPGSGKGLQNRSDLQALSLGIQAQERMQSANQRRFWPTVGAFGVYELNDVVNAQNFLVGVRLQWNIFEGGTRAAKRDELSAGITGSRLQYEEALAQSRLALQSERHVLDLVDRQLETIEQTIRQTEEILRMRRNRYDQGMEKTSDILQWETMLTHQRLKRLEKLFERTMSIAKMELLLERNFLN